MRIGKYFVLLFLVCFLVFPSSALARSLFEHQSTIVPEDETVNDVVVIGGDATILGHVSNSMIVFNGDAYIRPSARIDGFVMVIGGKVHQAPGAQLEDDIINISFDNATQNSLLIGGGLIIGVWALQLAGSLIMMMIPLAISFIGKRRVPLLVEKVGTTSLSRMLYTGFFSGLILAAVSLILLLTIIGIPIILVIGLYILASIAVGLTVISYHMGGHFRGISDRAGWIKCTAGAFILTAAVNIPLIGMFIFLAIVLISLGITTQWAAEKLRRKK